MWSKPSKKRIVLSVLPIAVVCAAVVTGPVANAKPADQVSPNVVVPNNYNCYTDNYARHGWCFQTNPPHDSTVFNRCHWYYGVQQGAGTLWYTGCDQWGANVH